jgi:protocatechuate 3,4-dioxygenase beta subunit
VVVVADGAQSPAGPFAFTTDLYSSGGDLLATANGRESVTGGIPLTLNFVLYAVDTSKVTTPLEGAELFLWQADTLGDYSAVASLSTADEQWLRARATSDANGKLNFSTILPGWYPNRAVHWHVKARLPGAASFYVTTQFYVADDFLRSYQDFGI